MTKRRLECAAGVGLLLLAGSIAAASAEGKGAPAKAKPTTRPAAPKRAPTTQPASRPAGPSPVLPCPATTRPALLCEAARCAARAGQEDIPRFAVNSPFGKDYTKPTERREKVLWAKSCLWQPAPELVVEKWLTAKPDTKGKYVLIEFWATWCPPCRRSISLLNQFHRTCGKDLVVIGISDQPEADVRKLKTPKIEYFSAIDTKARMKNRLEVRGIPHAIILEPSQRVVIWEGFPFLKGHELTEEIIRKIVSIKPKGGT